MRKQQVLSEPRKLFVGSYLTNKGIKLLKLAKTKEEKDIIKRKYSKNRYKPNKNAKQVKEIKHVA